MNNLRLVLTFALITLFTIPGIADDGSSYKGMLGIGAGLAVGIAALGGTLGQGKAAAAALDGIARNPGASGKIFVPMILGLALIESLVVLTWVIANGLASYVTR